MRKQLSEALVLRSTSDKMTFLTGDLGFMALEGLRTVMGRRFINAGVAEQNMISVAAAMAKQGLEVWVYSIAPFCYARPFEQIRNDICFHDLPVKIIGNGGGYGYGVMGPTHHAIEDYGVLLTLPMMSAYVPVFDEDLYDVVSRVGDDLHPTYLRLGRGEPPKDFDVPAYAPWRQLTSGQGKTVIAVGPIAATYITAFNRLPKSVRPNLWAVAELPIAKNPLPTILRDQIKSGASLMVIEEHVCRGGFGSELSLYLLAHSITPKSFLHFYAQSHTYSHYGSQAYLRNQSGLGVDAICAAAIAF
jgi:transketolase